MLKFLLHQSVKEIDKVFCFQAVTACRQRKTNMKISNHNVPFYQQYMRYNNNNNNNRNGVKKQIRETRSILELLAQLEINFDPACHGFHSFSIM